MKLHQQPAEARGRSLAVHKWTAIVRSSLEASRAPGISGTMSTVQTQLQKIRSDAAECMLLSKLVPDGKGQLFIKTAEHLNALALELEKTVNGVGQAPALKSVPSPLINDREETVISVDTGNVQPRARSHRMLTLMLLGLALVGFIGASSQKAKEYWSYAFRPTQETASASSEQTTEAIATLLSTDQAERRKIIENLNALTARLDILVSSLKNPNAARVETEEQSGNEAAVSEQKSLQSEAMEPAQGEKSAINESPAPGPGNLPSAKQADGVLTESVDRVGAIANPRRGEPIPRRAPVGPQGCTQFRSFDPVSQTYMTLDGRRRECRL